MDITQDQDIPINYEHGYSIHHELHNYGVTALLISPYFFTSHVHMYEWGRILHFAFQHLVSVPASM
jgi:hypothetical protein